MAPNAIENTIATTMQPLKPGAKQRCVDQRVAGPRAVQGEQGERRHGGRQGYDRRR